MQEAFTNIRKHSMATDAVFQLEAGRHGWRLLITDNGCGLQLPLATDHNSKTYGIDLMQKRASELGATMELQSEKGAGTKLIVQADAGGAAHD
ncbi:Sensor histidine kinase LiaS [compost metagenome]